MSQIDDLTKLAEEVGRKYKEEYPDVKIDRDYFPFKLTEEWGECLQAYLMLTDRGRQKGLSKDEIRDNLAEEMADVFGYLLLFAHNEGIHLPEELSKKWFVFLNKENK